ncbi:pseudoazurin [Sphingomonas oryzagri]|uniref:Pseudoazurin n=1 Tax=Sphingomonas oryzagri TaxID=3042314 RepID=A0ABT6MXZ8_9SPHN|nr:pseudoazurin [Sphingomonas oryzagri]MDH7637398.1 pseudoazurin [Sphingomonas oryzagri]
MKIKVLGLATVACAMLAVPATAKDITVQMKNQGAAGMMVFEPSFVQANVGDKVHFVPTDSGHNAEPITGMLPDGVSEPAGAMGKEYVLTISKPGLYGIKCKPHYSMGMVALVKAGKGASPNAAVAAAVKLPPLATKRMAPMLAQAK